MTWRVSSTCSRSAREAVRLERFSLAEVDDELRQAYEIPDYVKVVILDPGEDFAKLGIGELQRGYGIYMMGNTRVSSLREALDRMLESLHSKGADQSARIVYTFWDDFMNGTNTQHLNLTPEQIEELKLLRARLGPETPR
jgi:hypothetical protein